VQEESANKVIKKITTTQNAKSSLAIDVGAENARPENGGPK